MADNVIRMPNVHPNRNVSIIFSVRIFMGHLLDFSQAMKPAYHAPEQKHDEKAIIHYSRARAAGGESSCHPAHGRPVGGNYLVKP